MLKIKEVKTAFGKIGVPVIFYKDYTGKVIKHLGSAKDEKEIEVLKLQANQFIKDYTQQLSVFPVDNPNSLLFVDQIQCLVDLLSIFKKHSATNRGNRLSQ